MSPAFVTAGETDPKFLTDKTVGSGDGPINGGRGHHQGS